MSPHSDIMHVWIVRVWGGGGGGGWREGGGGEREGERWGGRGETSPNV